MKARSPVRQVALIERRALDGRRAGTGAGQEALELLLLGRRQSIQQRARVVRVRNH